MEDPVDHTLGRSIQVGIHGEKLLAKSSLYDSYAGPDPATSDTLQY
jgi:hypothetical protein